MRWASVVAVAAFVAGCAACGGSGSGPTSRCTAPAAASPPSSFRLPTRGTLLVIGDSWTAGYYARPRTNGYAYLTARALGLCADVRGGPGTGYVNPGGGQGTYAQRLAQLPGSHPALVIVQGSYNDLQHTTAAAVATAERRTLAAVEKRYPASQIVVLGTGTTRPSADHYVFPDGLSIDQLDATTRAAARAERLHYISPVTEAWFPQERITTLITNAAHPHPSNAGHALFAKRLVADLRRLDRRP